MPAQDPVAIAEELVKLVKSISEPQVDLLKIWNTKIEIQNTCDSLLAEVLGPLELTVLVAESCHESSALNFVTSLGIADFIGEGEGTLLELSKKADVDPQFLGVAMSCVIGRGYFEEVGRFGSHIYKNNELSQILRESHPSTLKSTIGFICDEAFRASSYLLDAAKTTSPVSKDNKKLPAVNIAFNFSGPIFEWMARPEESYRGKRMGEAMQQLHGVSNANVSKDYPWDGLSTPIVDIGSGIGTLEMGILEEKRSSHLDFILFDIPQTIENAKKVWSSMPPAVSSHVSFVGGNFLASSFSNTNMPQGKPTYIIRHVLHNWTDDEVIHILSNVRQAMPKQNGRLLLVEILLRPDSSRHVRLGSVRTLALNNGITRTQGAMEALVVRAGFKVSRVTHMRALDSVVEAVL